MTNIASILKDEMSRIARKEGRNEVEALRKSVSSQRNEISGLKRRLAELEKALRAVSKAVQRSGSPTPDPDSRPTEALRFRPAGMSANRKRLGLSASDFGRLVGVTGQVVYAWESGKSKPSRQHLVAIAALRGAGKRLVAQRLAELE